MKRALITSATALAVLAAIALALDQLLPPPIPNLARGASVIVLARDGTPLRAFADQRGVWRNPVALEQVAPSYLMALVQYEDRWFFRHPGVNPVALLRAAAQLIWHGEVVSGGSTLTMQVARLIEPMPRGVFGKCKQMLRALQLERRLSKREILALYLNLAPFGGNIEGVEAASRAYLGKSAARLSLAESALLAVLPQRPSRLRPDRHPVLAQLARDKVLARLQKLGAISSSTLASARLEQVYGQRARMPMLAPLLAERLRRQYRGQARIQSSIDAEWQRIAEQRVQAHLQRYPEATSAAVMVLEHADMSVRVYIGSADLNDDRRLGHIDMLAATRSPGSTLKPFLYGLALDQGLVHSESLLVDAPQNFSGYSPGNFFDAFNGPVSVAQALRLSLNVPAVDLLERIGPGRFAATLEHAGLNLRWPDGGKPNLALILGGAGVRMEQLMPLYAALARDGYVRPLHWLQQPETDASSRRLLSPGAAWIVQRMLAEHPLSESDALFRSALPRRLAFKTGTSFGFRDAWAFASDEKLTLGVWIGRPDGTPVPGSFGAVSALPLLMEIHRSLPGAGQFQRQAPPGVRPENICWPLGLAQTDTAPAHCHRTLKAWVLNQTVPPTLPDRSPLWQGPLLRFPLDAQGRRLSAECTQSTVSESSVARWPTLLEPWLSNRLRRLSSPPTLRTGCGKDPLARSALNIDGVRMSARLTPAGGSGVRVPLQVRAVGAEGSVLWLLNDRAVARSSGLQAISIDMARNGRYRLVALDASGRFGEVRFLVSGIVETRLPETGGGKIRTDRN